MVEIIVNHIATKINDLTETQLDSVETFAKSLGFGVSMLPDLSDYSFFVNYPKYTTMIEIRYSASHPKCDIHEAHVYISIPRLDVNVDDFGRFAEFVNKANDIAKMVVKLGGN